MRKLQYEFYWLFCGAIHRSSRLWPTTEDTISTAIDILKKDKLIKDGEKRRLIVQERWHRRIYIVLDICNDAYDPDLGHILERNNLPVLAVYFSKRESSQKLPILL
jgi:hypothetical protein